jgi:putative FmdB family regulatory protein
MPTYEYECGSGHRYEKREGFDAPATQRCPTCRKTARRVLHPPPIVFKGSGFYVTDSRTSSPAASESTASSGESKPETPATEGKAETKTESSEPKAAPAATEA